MPVARRTWILLFAGLCGFFGLTAHGYIENTDVDVTLHSARAMALRGDPGLLRDGPDVSIGERYVANRVIDQRWLGQAGRGGKAYVCLSLGHQLLMVPCIALGERLSEVWPEPEAELRRTRPPLFSEFFWSRFLISFLSPIAAAGAVLVMLGLALSLGASRREALLVTAVATLCTQFWPASSETLSDGPGLFFVLAACLAAIRYQRELGDARTLLWGGAAAGCAVLMRYPHAVLVAVLSAWLVWAAVRRGRSRDLLAWLAGGTPALGLFLAANAWRFGDPFDLGYTGADAAWWSYPLYLGGTLILLAPGKGVLWFSLPLWPALFALVRRPRSAPAILALALFGVSVVLYGHAHGWAGGQCWGVRYVTPAVMLVVVVGLTLGWPWRCKVPFALLCVAGLLISLGGVLTPYRGHLFLAHEAAKKYYQEELARGDFGVELLHDRIVFDPRFSPLHTHWLYAWFSARGELGPGPAERNVEPVFGIEGPLPSPVPAFPREDLGFRHLWLLYLHDLIGTPWLLPLLLWMAVTATLLAVGLRGFARSDPPAKAPS